MRNASSAAALVAPSRGTLLIRVAVSLLGLAAGLVIARLATAERKWLAVALATIALPLFVIAMGSLRDSLWALLIASLSVAMDVNPWWSDRYMEIRKGVPISLTAVVLVASLAALGWDVILHRCRLRFYPSVTVPLLFVAFWAALSSSWALYPVNVLYNYPMLLTCALIFFYAANALGRPSDLRLVVDWIAITVAVSSILGLLEVLTAGAVNLRFLGAREQVLAKQYADVALTRVSGTLRHANTLAFFLNGFLPLLAVHAVAARAPRQRWLCGAALALGFVTLILTFTRAAWVAFVLSVLVASAYFFTPPARRQFTGVWLRLLGVGFLVTLLALPLLPKVIFRLTQSDYGAAYQRIPLMKTALKVIGANPVSGIGFGNYKEAVPSYEAYPQHDAQRRPNYVHNILLLTAAELGIPAMLAFLWMYGVFALHALRCAFSGNDEKSLLGVAALAGLAGMFAHGMVEWGSFASLKFVWIMFLGGLLVAADSWPRAERSPRTSTA